jgi:hypothetical protein
VTTETLVDLPGARTSGRTVAAAAAPLRVGLLMDTFAQREWVCRVVEGILRSGFATPVLVVQNATPRSTGFVPFLRRAYARRQHLLRKLYVELDERIFRSEPDPFKPRDLCPMLSGVPVLQVAPLRDRYCDYFPEAAISAIRDYDLDVALRFGFRILQGDALRIARFGVWSYHHGDNGVVRGGPAGFWEVMLGHHVTGSILQILTPELDAGRVLYRSWASTYKYSVRRNKQNFYWKSSSFVLRKLKDLHEEGPSALEAPPSEGTYRPYSHRLYRSPSNAQMVPLVVRLGARIVRRAVRGALFREQWVLGYKLGHGPGPAETLHDVRLLVPPKDRFWADPFPVETAGRYVIFVEELIYGEKKGTIAALELDPNGVPGPSVRVLEKPYHLSYPFSFEWKGEHFMLPETRGNRTVELYRSTRFPFEWTLEAVLLEDLEASDSTLAEVAGQWWMFTSINVQGATTSDELHLFHAPSPLGPWTPHRRNPVKSDVRSSRSAGRLFAHRGDLYRPAQDSSVAYGYAIALNRIVRLDTDGFVEEEVSKILPGWKSGVERTHTLNSAGRLTVVDGLRMRRRLF